MGISIFSCVFVTSSSSVTALPRRSYSEFDLLYGIALDEIFSHYERPADNFHASLSTGISFDLYQERWRRFGRSQTPNLLFPPNTFEYSFGIPIQVQVVYEPLRYAGIGAVLFANFSGFTPSLGGAIVIEARY